MARTRVIIVGAGLAGLACAAELDRAGLSFRLVDKGRGAGGRCSSRRSSFGRFDHGAPQFKVTDDRFAKVVEAWEGRGLVVPFGDDAARSTYIGTPAMNSFIRFEAERLDAEFGLEIGAPLKHAGQYSLYTTHGEAVGDAEFVVFAAPAPQTAERLPRSQLLDGAKHADYEADWVMMAAWEEDGAPAPWADTSLPDAIASIEWQDQRPERSGGPRIVAKASRQWVRENLDLPKPSAAYRLFHELKSHVNDCPDPAYLEAHRWRYSRVTKAVGEPFGLDTSLRLATCGDWHLGPNCEDAWLSGHQLGQALAAELT